MSKETAYVILATLLLLQGCCGKPDCDNDPKSSEQSEESREVNSKIKHVFRSGYEDLSTLLNYIFTESEKLFKDVLADANETGDKSNQEITAFISLISAVLDKLEKVKKLPDNKRKERWTSANNILEVLEDFDISKLNTPSVGERVFSEYFKKHGVEDFEKEFKTKSKEVVEKIEEKLKSFWNDLSTEEQDKLKNLNKWRLKLKETREENKLDMMEDLVNATN